MIFWDLNFAEISLRLRSLFIHQQLICMDALKLLLIALFIAVLPTTTKAKQIKTLYRTNIF